MQKDNFFILAYCSIFRANLLVIICLFFTVLSTAQIAHINYPDMPADKDLALKIDIGDSQNDSYKAAIRVTVDPLTTGQVGQREVLRGYSTSNYSTQSGSTFSQLGGIHAQSSFAGFLGVFGEANVSTLANSHSSLISNATGGYFRFGLPSTTLSLGSGKFQVAGVLGQLNGTINSDTNADRAIAAVVGLDLSTGTAQSWAAYLEGKNYLSDQTIIGRKNIPTQINLPDGAIDVSNFKLFVKGGIVAEECLIALESLWADYVFEENYDLKSLEEVEEYINKNGYLPAFPSALEIDKMGLAVGQITVLQQEKIEELFLHSIELNKRSKDLVSQNEQLKAENEQLKAQMAAFEQRLTALENK